MLIYKQGDCSVFLEKKDKIYQETDGDYDKKIVYLMKVDARTNRIDLDFTSLQWLEFVNRILEIDY